MKLLKYAMLSLAVMAPGAMNVQAQPAAVSADSAADAANAPVLKIGEETVTGDQITSFSHLLGQIEPGYPPEGAELLGEYLLTQLYDKIPTTATIPAEKPMTKSSPVTNVNQRGLLKRLLQQVLLKQVEVPRDAMEAWYKENAVQYQRPEQVHAWHIFMETSDDEPSSAPAKVREKLEEAKAKIDSGTSFSEVAQEFSEAASAEKGGEIGMISPRLPIGPLHKPMNPELEAVFFRLPVNQVSDVVETRHGLHLLYITEKQTTRTPTVDDLITSGILPGPLAQERVTSRIQELTKQTIDRHEGKLLPGFDDSSEVTTDTVAFSFDDRKTTLGDLEQIFGERLTAYIQRIKDNKDAFRKLMQDGMEDEALILAAIDMHLTNEAETSRTMAIVARRNAATKHVEAIVNAEATVTEAEVRAKYDELEDQLRQPEAEGYLVEVQVKQTTDTAEMAKAQEEAMKAAQAVAEIMKDGTFEAVQTKLQEDKSQQTTVTKIARHVVNHSTETALRLFDRAMMTVTEESGVSNPTSSGDRVVVAKLEARYPGNLIPLEDVQERIKSLLEQEKRASIRQDLVKRLIDAGLASYLPMAAKYGVSEEGKNGAEIPNQTTPSTAGQADAASADSGSTVTAP